MKLSRNRNIWVGLLLAAATLAVYWQVQNFDFVNFDDNTYIYDNSRVQNGLTFDNITWAFTIVTSGMSSIPRLADIF